MANATTPRESGEKETASKRPPKAHPFLPRALHTRPALQVLRKTHSWVGITGATAAIVIAISGITLNHNTVINPRIPVPTEDFQLEAPADGFAAQADFERFLIDSLEINGHVFVPEEEEEAMAQRESPAAAESGGRPVAQPRRFVTHFATATEQYDIRYVEGNPLIDITHIDRGVMRTFNNLHLAQVSGNSWVFVIDVLSVAMVVLALSGLLLWSRLTGPRLLALGLAGSMLLSTIYFALVL